MDDDRADARDSRDDGATRTPAWYMVRLELGAGVFFILLIAFIASSQISCLSCDDAISLGPLLLYAPGFGAIAALPVAIAGLIWMVRILRGPRDEPPLWRYRDR